MLLITSHFILWLLQTSCSIFIDVACYNHSYVFYACCIISMHITIILAVLLKSAILLPKNLMSPILPLNKNYLINYLEPKYYIEVPKWQDDSWSGNRCCKHECQNLCIIIVQYLINMIYVFRNLLGSIQNSCAVLKKKFNYCLPKLDD